MRHNRTYEPTSRNDSMFSTETISNSELNAGMGADRSFVMMNRVGMRKHDTPYRRGGQGGVYNNMTFYKGRTRPGPFKLKDMDQDSFTHHSNFDPKKEFSQAGRLNSPHHRATRCAHYRNYVGSFGQREFTGGMY
jgi:hypothetical protein